MLHLEFFQNSLRSLHNVTHTPYSTQTRSPLSTPWIQAMVPCYVFGGFKNPPQDLGSHVCQFCARPVHNTCQQFLCDVEDKPEEGFFWLERTLPLARLSDHTIQNLLAHVVHGTSCCARDERETNLHLAAKILKRFLTPAVNIARDHCLYPGRR